MEEKASAFSGWSLDEIFQEKQFIFLALPFAAEFSLVVDLLFEAPDEVEPFFSLFSGQFAEMCRFHDTENGLLSDANIHYCDYYHMLCNPPFSSPNL